MKHNLVLVLLLQCSTAFANCPVGSYVWADEWGNKICKAYNGGRTKTIEGSVTKCPTGTYPWSDEWGNRICKAYDGGREWHDTSKGCPTGSYQRVDEWGNRICKKY